MNKRNKIVIFTIIGILVVFFMIIIILNYEYGAFDTYDGQTPDAFPPLEGCDKVCINRGFIEGICESGPGMTVDCNGGESIGQTNDCKTEGASGGSWKACCCYHGE